MTEIEMGYPMIVLFFGITIILARMIKSLLEKTVFPPLVGYLVLGLIIGALDSHAEFLSHDGRKIFAFLGQIGLITLLFHVGLESRIEELLHHARPAVVVWLSSVTVSGLFGYVVAFYVLELGFVTSLVVATAFTATSIGASVKIWHDSGAISSPNGILLLNSALLDDISAVVLMTLLFALLPLIKSGDGNSFLFSLVTLSGGFFVKILLFAVVCLAFARYCERRVTEFFTRLDTPQNFILAVSGIGFVIAAVAGLLGLSLAIGAFFAGLIFSYDPDSEAIDTGFMSIFGLFSPFFFINIGLDIDIHLLASSVALGSVLFIAAVLCKILGALPVYWMESPAGALLIGASMIPRAEITMIIMHQGIKLGDWAVNPDVYAGMVLVCVATSLLGPPTVRTLLIKWPQVERQERLPLDMKEISSVQ